MNEKSDLIPVTGLWAQKIAKTGEIYYSAITKDKHKLVIYPNKQKEQDGPTHSAYLVDMNDAARRVFLADVYENTSKNGATYFNFNWFSLRFTLFVNTRKEKDTHPDLQLYASARADRKKAASAAASTTTEDYTPDFGGGKRKPATENDAPVGKDGLPF